MSAYHVALCRRRNRAKGLCWFCTAKASRGRCMCAFHLKKNRESMRARHVPVKRVTVPCQKCHGSGHVTVTEAIAKRWRKR